MVKFGSARINEKGTVSGGQAGDQTKKEVAIENGYLHKKGWLAFKPKSQEVAEKLAKSMKDACNNDNIGYSQPNRLGVFTWVNGGIKIANIKQPTECDCSALVRACILEATGMCLLNFNTSSEPNILKNSGLFEPAFEVKSLDQLEVGTILVTKTKGHTVIVVEGNEASGGSSTAPKPSTSNSAKIEPSRYKDNSLQGEYITLEDLNIRRGGSVEYSILGTIPKGGRVKMYGYYNLCGRTPWYCVTYKGCTGYVNSKYLKNG